MVFEVEKFVGEMTEHLMAAMSFAMDADAEVVLTEPSLVRKVISTSTYSFDGEFAANEIFGTVRGTFAEKDGVANVTKIALKFGDIDAESLVQCGSASALLEGITNAYQVYRTRALAKPRQYEKLKKTLSQIDELACSCKSADRIHELTNQIRDQFGTDIELVDKMPQEKENAAR